MSATINLLDSYKKTCSIASDNACAVSLGIGRSAVSKWRKGEGHPDADSVAKMCDAMEAPLRQWLPLIEAERARTPAARKVWLRLAQAAAAVALAVGLTATPVHASGATSSTHNPGTLYIMSNLVRAIRTLGTRLAYRLARHFARTRHDLSMAV